jgi:hypothetical protein
LCVPFQELIYWQFQCISIARQPFHWPFWSFWSISSQNSQLLQTWLANLAKVGLSFIFLNASLKSAWQLQDEHDKQRRLKEGQPYQWTPQRRVHIREAENLFTWKWDCLDFIWSIINHIYQFLSHFDFMKSQKFDIEPVIWKGSQTQNQFQMTQYSIFYCIIDQNGLKKSKVT